MTFISTVTWTFAKTMPDWPHEYTIKGWRPEAADDFSAFCELVQNHGVAEAWPSSPAVAIYHNKYLVLGEHKYWSLGPRGDRDPADAMTVINRTMVRLDT